MSLTKYKIGNLIELFNEKCDNANLTNWDISGINCDKEFFEPSKQVGTDTSNYKNVPSEHFACNLMHVGRDKVLPIALNYTNKTKIVSPAYTIFKIKENVPLIKEYFFMMLKSTERDRLFWFHTDSSIRDGMAWNDFCDIELSLPPIDIQQKYVNIYKAMVANQRSYEKGLDDLRIVFEAYLDNLKKKYPLKSIDNYIELIENKNNDLIYNICAVRGISIDKKFINTKANLTGVNLKSYYIINTDDFAYVPVTSRNGEKISIALNDSNNTYICSSSYIVFKSKNTQVLLPNYLMLFFLKKEFDRYARFHSWGSARETFDFSSMCDVKIPIPDLKIQKAISDIYKVYIKRKQLNEQLKLTIHKICPILIKGSIEEALK